MKFSNCLSVTNFSFRILEEQSIRQYVLALFRLPRSEKLYEVASCSVWTPHSRSHRAGTLYTTDSYLCFSSREEGSCILLIPLSEVQILSSSSSSWQKEDFYVAKRCKETSKPKKIYFKTSCKIVYRTLPHLSSLKMSKSILRGVTSHKHEMFISQLTTY